MLTSAAVLPVTEAQQGLLVVHERVSCRHLYNELVRFDLDPAVPAQAVEHALETVVALQPGMRQVFAALPEPHARLTTPDVIVERAVVEPTAYERTIDEMARHIGRPPFDLATGPLFRFAAVRTTDGSASALLLCDHHIILDGVSMAALARDFEAVLAGSPGAEEIDDRRAAREAAFAKELAAQQRAARADGVAARVAAWAVHLRDVPPLVLAPLPGRPAGTAWTGARLSWALSTRDTEALNRCCQRLGVTPFVAFTAVYGAVLARHGGVTRVLVGSPFVTRRTIASFDLGGFFVNTLPVTVDVDWNRSADEHIGESVRAAVDHCRAHADVPFNRLVAAVAPDRSSDRNPLFSALLVMQEAGASTGTVRRITELPNGTAKFDLRLNVTPVDGTWLLELEYDTELIGPAVADGLLGSLRTAVRRAIDDGSRRLAELFVNTSVAASVRTDGWSGQLPTSPVEWVESVARRTPGAPALESASQRLTYAELVSVAGQVAAGLAERGVGRRDVVGIVAGDLCETAIAILATLWRGAAYLPLDPSLPESRLAYMIDRAGCSLVLGGRAPGSVNVEALNRPDVRLPAPEHDAELPVYVMFTSGSTGRPKGVQMGRRPLVNLAAWQVAALALDADTRFFQYAPLSFDVSFQEILPTLAAGGTVVSHEPVDRRDLPALLERVAATRVSHLYLPVPVLAPLLDLATARRTRLPDLRFVCVAGEQLLVGESTRAFFDAHPQCALVNLYGPTETHAVTAQRLTASDPPWPAHVPIGLPISNVAAYVVDVTGHLAPPGVAGELYLGGECVADGYVNDPARTAERFLLDRFSQHRGRRMYRSGDLALRDDDGALVFLGRADRQIKIRGYRIEPGEVEVVARSSPGVRHAVAVAHGEGADRSLVLFLVSEAGATVDAAALHERLAAELPSYMQPAHVHELETIPTTGTGKTDRDALVRLADRLAVDRALADDDQPADYADELERELGAVWSDVLGVDGIPRDASVLEHGAHSLNIFVALAQVHERFGVAVPMVDFFHNPTIATLAGLVRAGRP